MAEHEKRVLGDPRHVDGFEGPETVLVLAVEDENLAVGDVRALGGDVWTSRKEDMAPV